MFLRYIGAGFEHIVPLGLDHILFVLGLFFFATKLGPLLWQVTAFTVAHTVTLALAATGVVSVPASVVEPLIAATIVYVGIENTVGAGGMSGGAPRWSSPSGFLHGLGFASVLGDYGIAAERFAAAAHRLQHRGGGWPACRHRHGLRAGRLVHSSQLVPDGHRDPGPLWSSPPLGPIGWLNARFLDGIFMLCFLAQNRRWLATGLLLAFGSSFGQTWFHLALRRPRSGPNTACRTGTGA